MPFALQAAQHVLKVLRPFGEDDEYEEAGRTFSQNLGGIVQ